MPENILRKVDGPFVAQALQTLPSAESSREDFAETEIDVPVLGRVHFKCQRMTTRQGKNRFRFWSAIEAFQVTR